MKYHPGMVFSHRLIRSMFYRIVCSVPAADILWEEDGWEIEEWSFKEGCWNYSRHATNCFLNEYCRPMDRLTKLLMFGEAE